MRQHHAEAVEGLSPLARGNPRDRADDSGADGPIPARAGEPIPMSGGRCAVWAYPRSRGGTGLTYTPALDAEGLSPLARGNLSHLTR